MSDFSKLLGFVSLRRFQVEPTKQFNYDMIRLVSTLTSLETMVLTLWCLSGLTLREIGKIIGLTAERVRQIKEKALRRLRYKGETQVLLRRYISLGVIREMEDI